MDISRYDIIYDYRAEVLKEQRMIAPETTPVDHNIQIWLLPGEVHSVFENAAAEHDLNKGRIDLDKRFKIVLIDYLQAQGHLTDIEEVLQQDSRRLLNSLQSSNYSFAKEETHKISPASMGKRMYISGVPNKLAKEFKGNLRDTRLNENDELRNVLIEYPEKHNNRYYGVSQLNRSSLNSMLFHELTHAYSGVDEDRFDLYIEEAFAHYLQKLLNTQLDWSNIQGYPTIDCRDMLFKIDPDTLPYTDIVGESYAKEISWMAAIVGQVADFNCEAKDSFNVADWGRKEIKGLKNKEEVNDDISFLIHFIPNTLFNELNMVDEFYGKVLYEVVETVEFIYSNYRTNLPEELVSKIETNFKTDLKSKESLVEQMKEEKRGLNWLVRELDRKEEKMKEEAEMLEKVLKDLQILRRHVKEKGLKSDHHDNAERLIESIESVSEKIEKEETLAKNIEHKHEVNLRFIVK